MEAITSSQIWIWFVGGLAVVMIGGYVLVTKVGSVPAPIMQAGMQNMPAISREDMNMKNPLLSATMGNIYRYFPYAACFADIYAVKNAPSREGCIRTTIHHVQVETGVILTREQVTSPEVIAHFKKIIGKDSDKWEQ